MLEPLSLQLDLASLPGEDLACHGVVGRVLSILWATRSPALACLKAPPAVHLQAARVAECAAVMAARIADLQGRCAYEHVHCIPCVCGHLPAKDATGGTRTQIFRSSAGHMDSRLLANAASSVVPAGFDPSGQGARIADWQPIWSAPRHR